MKNLNMIAVDVGASSGRLIWGNYDGKTIKVEEIYRFTNQTVNLNGDLYWDVLSIFSHIKAGLIEFKKDHDVNIDSIGIDTWGVDFGLLDDRGQLVGNPHSYRDKRVDGMIKRANNIIGSRALFDKTGISAQPFNTIYQLIGMKRNSDTSIEKANTLLLMPDLLNYFFTGKIASEFTNATTTQLYSPSLKGWDEELIKSIDIDKELFIKITPSATNRGKMLNHIEDEIGYTDISVISVASHDTASAITVVPFYSDNSAFLSSGTWSILGITANQPAINDYTYENKFMNEGMSDGNYSVSRYIMGLWLAQECKRYWDSKGQVYSWDALVKMADSAKAFSAIINPNDQKFYTSGDMPQKIIDYCEDTNQTTPETKGEILRTILESLALCYRQAVEGIQGFRNKKPDVLNVVGGGTKNKLLNQFMANAIGKPVITGPIEGSALGNLMMQAKALGAVQNNDEIHDVIKRSFSVDKYMPEDTLAWDEAYIKYRKIVVQ